MQLLLLLAPWQRRFFDRSSFISAVLYTWTKVNGGQVCSVTTSCSLVGRISCIVQAYSNADCSVMVAAYVP